MLTCSGPSDVPAQRQRLLEQRQRLVVQAHALIDAADHRRTSSACTSGWSAEIAGDALGADIEQAAHGRLLRVRVAVRIGAVEQLGQQLADLRRLGGLQRGAIALVRELHGVERDRAATSTATAAAAATTLRRWRRTNLAAR